MTPPCIFCKRAVSDHTKKEALSCALEICKEEKMEF